MGIEDVSGLEATLSERAVNFVGKLWEIEGLIINARTQEDRNIIIELFTKLND